MDLISSIPNKLYKTLKEEISSLLLKEASDVSLHQMYDKIYGKDRVNRILALDTSSKKKYAEWVLKTLSKKAEGGNVGAPSWFDVTWDIHIVPLANAYLKNGFQPFSYDGLEYAYRAYDKILKSKKYDKVKPTYDDGAIMIYTPLNAQELRELLEIKFRKDPRDFNWCVLGADGQNYWDKYGQNNTYQIFLIYNKNQNKLYLWNNNPNENPYHNGLLCYEFNNWGNVTCSPTDDAQLTEGAIKFLNEHSSNECTFNNVIEYINNGGSNQFLVLYEGVLGGRYNIVDFDPEDVFEHDAALVSCENGEIVYDNFCDYSFNMEHDEKNIVIVSNSNGGYDIGFIKQDGSLDVGYIDDDEWGAYFRGTLAVALKNGLLIYDTTTDVLIDTGIEYIEPSEVQFEGTEDNKFIVAKDEDTRFFLIRAKDGQTILELWDVTDYQRDTHRNCITIEMSDVYDYEDDLSYFDEVIVKKNLYNTIIEYQFDNDKCYCYIPPKDEDDDSLEESLPKSFKNIITETLRKTISESYYNNDFDIDFVDEIVFSKEFVGDEEEDDMTDPSLWEFDITCYDTNGEECLAEYGIDFEDLENIVGEDNAQYIWNSEKEEGRFWNDSKGTMPSDINNVDEVNAIAKKCFTVTEYYPNERGYILTDGSFIYFGPNVDHVSISRIDGMTVGKFVSLGNIRVGQGSIELEKPPTYEQKKQLYKFIGGTYDDTYVDIVKYSGSGQYSRTLDGCRFPKGSDPRGVLNQIQRFFNEGIKMSPYELYESKCISKTKELNKKRIVITEEQFRKLLDEDIFINNADSKNKKA